MPEPLAWQVIVQSDEGLHLSNKQSLAFMERLVADGWEGNALLSSGVDPDVVGVWFTVDDPRRGFAIDRAIASFYNGLEAAGYAVDRPGWKFFVEAKPLFERENHAA